MQHNDIFLINKYHHHCILIKLVTFLFNFFYFFETNQLCPYLYGIFVFICIVIGHQKTHTTLFEELMHSDLTWV